MEICHAIFRVYHHDIEVFVSSLAQKSLLLMPVSNKEICFLVV